MNTAPASVLLVTYGGGHIPMVLAVMKALRAQYPGIKLELIALTTAYAAALAAGEKPWQYADLQHLADPVFVNEWGQKLAPATQHPTVTEEETRAYFGINFWDMAKQHGLTKAQVLFDQNGRHGFFPLNFFKKVIAQFAPSVVVATVSPRSEAAALQAAIELGVPTLSMTDLFLRSFDPYCQRSVYADCVTVINEEVRAALEAAGVSRQKLHVTGNPAFDGLKEPQLQHRAADFRKQLGWTDKTVALWAGHADYAGGDASDVPLVDYPMAVEAQLRQWVDADPARALIIRYHPNEAHLFANGHAQPRVFLSMPEQSVHEVVIAADVVIVQRSTVGLEAALAGKPVVAMINSPLCLRDDFNYEALGIAYGAPIISDLPTVIAAALQNGCAAPELANLGLAAPKVADLILGLVKLR